MENKKLQDDIQDIFKILKEKNILLSSCESYTGGAFANAITNVKGSSSVFLGSLVLYSNKIKNKIGKVKKRTIKKYGAVSQECAEEMAMNANKITKSHISISFTGNADINVIENKESFVGFISVYYLGKMESYKLDLSKNKEMNRIKFKEESIKFGISKILGILS